MQTGRQFAYDYYFQNWGVQYDYHLESDTYIQNFSFSLGLRTLLQKTQGDSKGYVITLTSSCPRWRLKSPACRLFTQPFIQTQIKENIKAPRHWPLCGNSPGQVTSPHKGPVTRKMFLFDDVIMSKYWLPIGYHVHIWQMSPLVRFEESIFFLLDPNFPSRKNNERSFSDPNPRGGGY